MNFASLVFGMYDSIGKRQRRDLDRLRSDMPVQRALSIAQATSECRTLHLLTKVGFLFSAKADIHSFWSSVANVPQNARSSL